MFAPNVVFMTSLNLTQQQAQRRTELFDVHNYAISLDLTDGHGNPGADTFRSVTTIDFEVLASPAGDDAAFLDLNADSVRAVTLNGVDITSQAVPLTDCAYDATRGLQLGSLPVGRHTLVVDAECRYSRTGEGLHRFVDPADGEVYLYSQFETAAAKRVFACFDQPDIKATYDIAVTAPQSWTVVSNSAPTIHDVSSGNRIHTFRVDVPLSTYLVAVCAGPWASVFDEWTGTVSAHPETPGEHQPDGEMTVPLGLFCRKSLFEHMDSERLFTETKQGFAYFAAHFGEPYAFGKYDQIFCPEYNWGAMENAGAVTIREEYVFRSRATRYSYERRNETILHEMAHMWFGDLVTMRWWDDLWLNESFATLASVLAQAAVSEYDGAWTTFANVEKAWAVQQDQLPTTHPISTDASSIEIVEQNFDGITYAKGASVLKQLAAWVGHDAFLAGARLHFARHRFANATFDDLLSAMSETSGRDLSNWAAQWLTTTGINTLAAEFTVGNDNTYQSFAVRQTGAAPGAGELRDHRVAVGVYSRESDGKIRRTFRTEIDVTGELTDVPALTGVTAGDLVLVNDDDLTYCLLELDQRSLATVIADIAAIEDPLARTLCWSAAWQMTRSGAMRARDFISLVLAGVGAESEVSVIQRVLGQGGTALHRYADPAWAESTGNDKWASGLLKLARHAAAGSDLQLALVNALAATELGDEHKTVFRTLLEGDANDAGLAGFTVDQEVRWTALIALVAAGELDEAAIVKEEAADVSALGEQSAARARAAVPTAAAKESIWRQATATGDDAPSNATLRAWELGLVAPGAAAALRAAGVASRYFSEVTGWWGTHSSDTAQRMAEALYPGWDIREEALANADDVLSGQLPTPVARAIEEGRDEVRRALAARRADAAN